MERLLPLYQQVKGRIMRSFADRKPGDRLPTETEYIKEFGVSITTIRQAMRTLEQEGWIEKRQGRGTFLLDPDARHGKHVALLLEADVSSDNLSPVYLKLLQELRLCFFKYNIPTRPYLGHLRLGVEIGELTCREFFDELRQNRINGVVPLLAQRHPSWISELQKRAIPIVGASLSADIRVGADHEKMICTMLDFFRSRGHERMAVLLKDTPTAFPIHFLELFRKHAPDYGITLAQDCIRDDISGLDAQEAQEAIREIWKQAAHRPDCVFIESDLIVEACSAAIEEQGNGSQVGLASWGSDAVKLAPRPNLIHCFVSVKTVAQICADKMKEYLEGREPSSSPVVPFMVSRGERRPVSQEA
ncbi:MAG TPA: GntR family transcriptional regulator [Chthoniobacteraceae bacterium]|nr:GntR family transcriptional regulator [Chthoniobacteraceae bacterium]